MKSLFEHTNVSMRSLAPVPDSDVPSLTLRPWFFFLRPEDISSDAPCDMQSEMRAPFSCGLFLLKYCRVNPLPDDRLVVNRVFGDVKRYSSQNIPYVRLCVRAPFLL